jgi:hypothetical protein
LADSCGTNNLEEAERFLTHRVEEIRHAWLKAFDRQGRFRAIKYLEERTNTRRASPYSAPDIAQLLEAAKFAWPTDKIRAG